MKSNLRVSIPVFLSCAVGTLINAFTGNPCCIPQRRDPIICYDDCYEYTSQTFMYTHPITHNIAAYKDIWHSLVYTQAPDSTAFQIIGIGQGSNYNHNVVRYFLFDKKTSLTFRGDDAPDARYRDVRSEWFGINNDNFAADLTLNPKQNQLGFFVNVYQPLDTFFNHPFFDDWWLEVRVPFVLVDNNIGLIQTNLHNPGTAQGPEDVIQAFNQPLWKFGRMGIPKTRAGIADISFLLGSTYLSNGFDEFAYYSGFSIPIRGSTDNHYIFDSVMGNNGHVSYDGGVNLQVGLNCDTDCYVAAWFLNLEVHWLFQNRQCRTFDLMDKPWSRYLYYNKKDGLPNQNVSGVNVLTRECKIRPYAMCEFNTGWRWITDSLEANVSYSLWGHGTEGIQLLCPFEEEWGIAGVGPLSPQQPGLAASASNSTIKNLAPNDVDPDGNPIFVTVKASDLNIRSVQSRSAIAHRINASIGFHSFGSYADGFLGFGGYYEWPQPHFTSTLQVWGLWAKFGASF